MSSDITTVPFAELQARLAKFGSRSPLDLEDGTIVVLPSLTFPPSELRKIIGIERYEERLLCLLLLLREPGLEMVYVTSAPVDEVVIDYYLSFLPDAADARRRATFVHLDDEEPRALTEKLLQHPEALDSMRDAIRDVERAVIVPFNVTELERDVAEALGVPVYGPNPELASWGSKSGARQVARDSGVPVLEGSEDLFSLLDVERAIRRLHRRRPAARAAVVKLNYGFSGQGNAIIQLSDVESPLDSSKTSFCASEESWPSFIGKIEAEGAIVEEVAQGEVVLSPSVQVSIAPDGSVEVISTHDQILGGPDDQVYLGCRFPAGAQYRAVITAHAISVARTLADREVVGAFGIDFIVLPRDGGHDVFLSEINLRLGGTTHPFLMARLMTEATYDPIDGELIAEGRPITYVSTDNLKSQAYVGLEPAGMIAGLTESGLAYDRAGRAGATLHLLGALPRYGKLGTLCIAPGAEAAEELYADVVATLDELAVKGH